MPTFISDPPQLVYLALFAALIVTAAVAAQRQDRKSIVAFAAALALLLVVFALDRFLDSPREEAVRYAKDMAAAANDKNPHAFLEHVGDPLLYPTVTDTVFEKGVEKKVPRSATREQLRKSQFWDMLRQFNVRVAAWDFNRDDVKQFDDDTVEIGFMAKGEAEGKPFPVYVRATYKRQPGAKFQLTEFRTFNPLNKAEPLPIPNFP